MAYPKSEAPYTEAGFLDSGPIVFELTEQTNGVLLSWTNTPFSSDGTRPATMVSVGKEYGTVASPYQLNKDEMWAGVVECVGQGLSCIPSPTGQPGDWPRDKCYTGIWDTPVAYLNGMLTTPYTAIWEIFIPYNQFQLAANSCAIQTDGEESQYYVELFSMGGNMLKTKWVFNYAAPMMPFNACGVAPVEPVEPTTPSGTEPAEPGKPGGGKGQGGGKPPKG